MATFGAYLRKLREAKGLTQEEAARLTGIPQKTWASYEQGYRIAPRKVDHLIDKLVEVFGVSRDEVEQHITAADRSARGRINRHLEEYKNCEERLKELNQMFADPKSDKQEIATELRKAVERMERTRHHLEKAYLELYPIRPIPVLTLPVVAQYGASFNFDLTTLHPDDVLETIPVPEDHPATIAIKVTGDSLVEVGISDGDYVLVDTTQKEVKDGDLIAARLYGSEGTVKYYRIVNGDTYLWPANRRHQPLKVTEDMNLEIVGVVKGVWKPVPPAPEEARSHAPEEENAR